MRGSKRRHKPRRFNEKRFIKRLGKWIQSPKGQRAMRNYDARMKKWNEMRRIQRLREIDELGKLLYIYYR